MNRVRFNWAMVAVLAAGLVSLQVARAGEAESPVDDEMQALNAACRKVNRRYEDPSKKDATLELIAEIQQHAETCKKLTPKKAEKLTGDEKAKYLATYQKHLDALLKDVAALKDAIAAGKTADAKAVLDKIGQMKESSHKELGVEEKKKDD